MKFEFYIGCSGHTLQLRYGSSVVQCQRELHNSERRLVVCYCKFHCSVCFRVGINGPGNERRVHKWSLMRKQFIKEWSNWLLISPKKISLETCCWKSINLFKVCISLDWKTTGHLLFKALCCCCNVSFGKKVKVYLKTVPNENLEDTLRRRRELDVSDNCKKGKHKRLKKTTLHFERRKD